MRAVYVIVVPLLALAGCGGSEQAAEPKAAAERTDPAGPAPVANPGPPPSEAGGWSLQSRGKGATLLLGAPASPTLRLICPGGPERLIVNVPGFRPIGSEERLSFGSGGEVEALVADTRGDRERGGVSGAGPVPTNLAALIGGRIGVSYGAQTSGPHPALPPRLAATFLSACGRSAPSPSPSPSPTSPGSGLVSACLLQDGARLKVAPLRAVGTEPFWGAAIEGRCVTYSHPENIAGTRVWTRYTATADGGRWTGALNGKPFELVTRAAPGCSDGMSDRRYPLAVELRVNGEKRRGCAHPAGASG